MPALAGFRDEGSAFPCLLGFPCFLCFRYTGTDGAVPKWPKGEVCKTSIRGFESHPRLQFRRRRNCPVVDPEPAEGSERSEIEGPPLEFHPFLPPSAACLGAVRRSNLLARNGCRS